MSVSMPENSLGCIKTFFVPSVNFSKKPRNIDNRLYLLFLSLPVWQLLTLAPYSRLTSRIVDRHILPRGGDRYES